MYNFFYSLFFLIRARASLISLNSLKILSFFLFLLSCQTVKTIETDYFKIRVVDSETGLNVPMIGLIPLSRQKYYTDSNGLIAFNEPGLMNEIVYFEINAEGYSYPMGKDGRRAISLLCKAGDSAIIKVERTNVAERLYRSTGLGIYKDSKLLGEPIPIKKPLINAGILGQDSNLATLYKGKIFWIWGDSFLPPKYHGNFSVSAATTIYPKDGGLNPKVGMNYNYILDEKGTTKPMINLKSPGYVWFDWLVSIKGKNGQEQLVAKYANVNAFFQNYERGVAIYNDEEKIFESVKQVDNWLPFGHRCEHPFMGKSKNQDYIYLTSEFDFQRVLPQIDSLIRPESYESFSCLKEGTVFDLKNLQLDRDSYGKLIYGWKKNTGFIDEKRQQKLVETGLILESERWTHTTDINTGKSIDVGRGSIFWNEFRKKWIMISGAIDIWYSEADTPVGPWVYARKVAEHQSFLYNPTQHPFFDQNGGVDIFFEGTFTKFFSKEEIVPYYDYNQIFYKLSLKDEQTFLPSPIYRLNSGYYVKETLPKSFIQSEIKEIPFLAMTLNRKIDGMLPIYSNIKGTGLTNKPTDGKPLFYAMPEKTNEIEKYIGIWETKILFSAFDNSFEMNINLENESIKISTDKNDFKISELRIDKENLFFTLTHMKDIYFMEAKISAGILKGSWSQGKTDFKGTWDGVLKDDDKWWGKFTTSLTPLYEYKNTATDNYRYSTDPNFSLPGFTKNNTPLCRVWINPIKQPIVDFETLSNRIESVY
jgi:hypothetical protein